MTNEEALNRLRAFVAKQGGQSAAARALGISVPYLHDILHGHRHLSDRMLDLLGLTRETTIKVKRSA